MEKRKLVVVDLAVLYPGDTNKAKTELAKAKLFNEEYYHESKQRIYTYTETLYGKSDRKNVRREIGVIEHLIIDDDGNPFFELELPETLAATINSIPDAVVVCRCRFDYDENHNPVNAYWFEFTLYRYSEYLELQKRRLERRVFKPGSVVPKKELSAPIQDLVDNQVEVNESEESAEAVEQHEQPAVETPVNGAEPQYAEVQSTPVNPADGFSPLTKEQIEAFAAKFREAVQVQNQQEIKTEFAL